MDNTRTPIKTNQITIAAVSLENKCHHTVRRQGNTWDNTDLLVTCMQKKKGKTKITK